MEMFVIVIRPEGISFMINAKNRQDAFKRFFESKHVLMQNVDIQTEGKTFLIARCNDEPDDHYYTCSKVH